MKFFLPLVLFGAAFGALPPLAQSTKELKSILSDQRFYESLGSAQNIQSIIHVEDGYLVFTQDYVLKVNVEYTKSNDSREIGPVPYALDFEKPIDVKRFSKPSY